MPLPAPGFPNMTILSTFPSLPAFPGSSFPLVALRKRLREETVEGVGPPSLNTAEPQCLDVHCRGDMSMGEGGGEGRDGWGEKVSPPELIYIGEALMGIGEQSWTGR